MSQFQFSQVDVFGASPLLGNPLAVVHGADDLTGEQMQAFARWTGLSETTFLLNPTPSARDAGADYRVRIFTTTGEYPFAGHPTLGSAHAWLTAAGIQRQPDANGSITVIQECGVGLVPIKVTPHEGSSAETKYSFAAPDFTRFEAVEPEVLDRVLDALGLEPSQVLDSHWIANGPQWLGLMLDSAETVLSVNANLAALGDLEVGLLGRRSDKDGGKESVEVRALGASFGEDPVTGSLNAGFARWLCEAGQLPRDYTAHQGQRIGADGLVNVTFDGADYWIGGACSTIVSGTVQI